MPNLRPEVERKWSGGWTVCPPLPSPQDLRKPAYRQKMEKPLPAGRRRGIQIERVLTDNGACYKSRKFGEACREFGIQHKRTRPYRPQTNGKAERFIQTALKEWAYAQTHPHSWKRTAYLSKWTHHYNFVRPHSVLGRKPPASCLNGG